MVMEQKQNRLTDVRGVTFGTTASTRRNAVSGILGGGALSLLAWQLAFIHPALLLAPFGLSLNALVSLTNRHNFEIDFDNGVYFIVTGSWPAVRVTGGRSREIARISLTRILLFDTITYAAFIVFHPEVKREPYRIDSLSCSVRKGGFADRFSFYLELAARLNIPVFDDSGWNGKGAQASEPKLIVIQPGETHPALQYTATKWNKW